MNNTYRVYNETNTGYKLECQVGDLEELLMVLDVLILYEEANKVLVIENDMENNCEFPLYLFTGSKVEYLTFKDAIIDMKNDKVLAK